MRQRGGIVLVEVFVLAMLASGSLAAQGADARRSHAAFDAAMGALTATPVGNGNFTAIASPWASDDPSRPADLERFTGSAAATSNGTEYVVLLCDHNKPLRLSGTLTFAERSGTHASPNMQYDLPNPRAIAVLASPAAILGGAATGTLSVSQIGKSISGLARLRFPAGKVGKETGTEPIDVAISFRAPVEEAKAGAVRSCSQR